MSPDPPIPPTPSSSISNEELAKQVQELVKVNSNLMKQLEAEKEARVRGEIVTKICAINSEFKDLPEKDRSFIEGIHWAYSHPVKPSTPAKGSPSPNGASTDPTHSNAGAPPVEPQSYFTPEGYVTKDKLKGAIIQKPNDSIPTSDIGS